ncbi:hypothetical protein JCM6882_000629 [Rhodosporidiobolus microsporus]
MLDRLPPEILDDILLLAAPPPRYDDEPHREPERRKTLLACCLVSKALCSCAQRLLWGNIVLSGQDSDQVSLEFRRFASLLSLDIGESKDDVTKKRLEQSIPRLMGLVRTFRVQKYALASTERLVMLFDVLASLPPTVQQVQLDLGSLGLARAQSQPLLLMRLAPVARNLSSFSCAKHRIVGDTPPLSSLTILSLREVRGTSPTYSALFCSTTLPSLRVLAFDIHLSSDDPLEALTPSFVSQLDVLQLETDDFLRLSADLFPHPFALVVDWITFSCLGPILARVQHLQLPNFHLRLPLIYLFELSWAHHAPFNEIKQAFDAFPTLRAFRRPTSAHLHLLPSVDRDLEALMPTCEERGTEVCYGVKPEEVWAAVKRIRARADEQ